MIIIPKAKTTAEKLEMRGEKVDVNNIKRSIQEDMGDLKKKAQSWGNEIKEWGSGNRNQSRHDVGRFFNFLGDIVRNVFRILFKLLTVLFVIIAAIVLCVFISILFSYKATDSILPHGLGQLLFNADYLSTLTIIALILVVAIPLLALIYRGTATLIGVRKKNRFLTQISGGLWIAGIVLLIFVGLKVASDFSARAKTKTTFTLLPAKKNILYLNTLKDAIMDEGDEEEYDYKWTFNNNRQFNIHNWGRIDNENGKVFLGYPLVDIQPSQNDSVQVSITRIAHGENKKEAFNRTRNIIYNLAQHDSLIEFPRFFEIKKTDKYRAQQVRMTLYIPNGQIIHLGEGMGRIIYDIENVSNTYDGDMVNHNWVMTKNGLKCLDCTKVENDDEDQGESYLPSEPPYPPSPPNLMKKQGKNRIEIRKPNGEEIIIENNGQ